MFAWCPILHKDWGRITPHIRYTLVHDENILMHNIVHVVLHRDPSLPILVKQSETVDKLSFPMVTVLIQVEILLKLFIE